jgi:hypothetical protein
MISLMMQLSAVSKINPNVAWSIKMNTVEKYACPRFGYIFLRLFHIVKILRIGFNCDLIIDT